MYICLYIYHAIQHDMIIILYKQQYILRAVIIMMVMIMIMIIIIIIISSSSSSYIVAIVRMTRRFGVCATTCGLLSGMIALPDGMIALLTFLVNLQGTGSKSGCFILVTHFSLPILVYQFQGH